MKQYKIDDPEPPTDLLKSESKEPSKLDQAFEKAQSQPSAVLALQEGQRYLIFRPYIDPISIRPYKP